MKILSTILFMLIGQSAWAQQPKIFSTDSGAVRGYDVVSYFIEGKPVKGKSEISWKWKDAVWYFSTAQNLQAFQSNPEKYAPQYGGYCAFGASRGYKAETQPDAFTIFNGKLYLNYNTDVMVTWGKKKTEFISKADEHWITLEKK